MLYTATTLKRRVRFFFALLIAFVTAITGRLVYVQLFNAQSLRALAAEQWYRDLPLMARRGAIYDRNGILMAQSTMTFSIYVRPVAVTNPAHVAEILSRHLGLNYDTLYKKVTSKTVSEHLIKMQVDKSTALDIIAHGEDGIFASQTYRRDYPLGPTGGQVMGLVSIDNHGQEGVEAFYDNYLRGLDGRSAVASDLRGKPIKDGARYYVPSVAGSDVYLNVDAKVQAKVQEVVARARLEQNAKNVSCLVMDVETNGIVASAAAPFFDLNDQPRDDVATLMDQIKNIPLINVLEPGSTFKILTLAAAIEEGVTNESDHFTCNGSRTIAGENVKCWRSRGHGTQTLGEAVMNSCNCCFMDLALRLGVDRFYAYLDKFGIGKKTGVDAFAESSGLVLNKKIVRPVDLARIGFGQAIAVSPVQFLSFVNAAIGDGILRTPRIVNHIDGHPQAAKAATERRILTQNTVDRVRELLYGVVEKGSGKHAGVNGFRVGGKTGTAQKYKDGIIDQGKYVSSFVGFITVNGKAKYTVYLMVDEPAGAAYYGSIVAAPYVGQIFNEIILSCDLVGDPAVKAPFIQDWLLPPNAIPPLVEMPDVAGMDLFSAVAKLQTLGFFVDVDGEGSVVKGTFPQKGSFLKTGEPVVVLS